MKTWDKYLVSILDTILPTYAENTEEPVEVPCITYHLVSDARLEEGDDIRYSRPVYQIKLYVKDLEDADEALTKIDEELFKARIFRESLQVMKINNLRQYIMNYSIHTVERI